MIKYHVGNLITAIKNKEVGLAGHGCNIWCSMGSGIAPLMAELTPGVRNADNATIRGSVDKLGTVTTAMAHKYSCVIINMYTQANTARFQGELVVDYSAISKIFKSMEQVMRCGKKSEMKYPMAIPLIGAGLAGGDWKVIECIIDRVIKDETVDVFVMPSAGDISKVLDCKDTDYWKVAFPVLREDGAYHMATFDDDFNYVYHGIAASSVDGITESYKFIEGEFDIPYYSSTLFVE